MAVIDIERHDTTVVLTVNRPRALNAINAEVLDELSAAIHDVEADASVRAVVLTGAGKAFIAGADIAAMASLSAVEAEQFSMRGQKIFARLSALPVPVIAAVGGFALGGGCELAMACDIVIAGPKAKFGQPEVKLGVIPGFGGTQRLVRRVGMATALDLCLTGRIIGAEEALRIGMVSRVIDGDVVDAALKIAATISNMGPTAIRLAKRAIHENANNALESAQAAEASLFGLCFSTAEQTEGMAAFLEKRSANFS